MIIIRCVSVVNAGNFGCDMFQTNHNTARVPRYQHEGEISFELNHIFVVIFTSLLESVYLVMS